jgi:hypothetical protein
MESIIRLACIAHRTDYWIRGRTVERLGIHHLSVSELTRYVTGEDSNKAGIQYAAKNFLSSQPFTTPTNPPGGFKASPALDHVGDLASAN